MRVQVNLNDELVKKIDAYAESIGLTRSAVCAFWIGQGVLGYDKAMTMLQNMENGMLTVLEEKDGQLKIS